MPVTVHLVRHGQVENPKGVIYGRLPGYHLSERGIRQARAAAQRLRLRVLANPVATGRGGLNVTCSIGFALSADAGAGIEWLVGRAREARHAAQCEGGDRVVAAA